VERWLCPKTADHTTKVSDHVWEIEGVPNIAIVAARSLWSTRGWGPRTIARVAAKLAPAHPRLYLTTTHFHPEHAAGEAGLPSGLDKAASLQVAHVLTAHSPPGDGSLIAAPVARQVRVRARR